MVPGRVIEPELSFTAAKLGHLVLFGGWTAIVGMTLMIWRGSERLNLKWLWIAAVTFGAVIEILQTALPFDREGSLLDVVINAVGVSAACLVLRKVQRNHVARAIAAGGKREAVLQPVASVHEH